MFLATAKIKIMNGKNFFKITGAKIIFMVILFVSFGLVIFVGGISSNPAPETVGGNILLWVMLFPMVIFPAIFGIFHPSMDILDLSPTLSIFFAIGIFLGMLGELVWEYILACTIVSLFGMIIKKIKVKI